jgi:hypothetical protein
MPQIGGLRLADPTFAEIDRPRGMNPRHDHARAFRLGERLK